MNHEAGLRARLFMGENSLNYDSRRWVYLLYCVTINICVGFCYAWSVFQKPLINLFQWAAIDVAVAFSLIMSMSALPMAVAGKAQDYIEPKQVILLGGLLLGGGVFCTGYVNQLWQLYLTYGLVAGLGIGIVYAGTVANIVRFFPDRRGMAAGLLSAGFGSGAVILAPISSKLIELYGVLHTFKVLGLVFLMVICGMSRLVKTAPAGYLPAGWTAAAANPGAGHEADKNWRQMLTTPLFYVLALVFILGTTSGLMIMGHASPIAQEILRITPQEAAVIVGLLALANTTGRAFWGGISDKTGRYPILLVMYVIAGIAMLLLSQVSAYGLFVASVMFIALCYGGFMGMMASLTADTFGTKYLGVNFGIMFLTVGFAAYIGPRLAAAAKASNNGDYSQAFLIACALNAAGFVIALLTFYRQRQGQKV
jgi:OFA family oxalate/formate antiporter-like MFS transporter